MKLETQNPPGQFTITNGRTKRELEQEMLWRISLPERAEFRPVTLGWSQAEVDLLRELWDRGQTCGQIAKRLGRSRGSISSAARRFNLARRHITSGERPC